MAPAITAALCQCLQLVVAGCGMPGAWEENFPLVRVAEAGSLRPPVLERARRSSEQQTRTFDMVDKAVYEANFL